MAIRVTWPNLNDYNEAIQDPADCFADPELQQGRVSTNALGLPMPCTGSFGAVYRVHCPARPWAVKCFSREVRGLERRYQAISAHLNQVKLPYMVDFQYLQPGIRVNGQWYPVLKMEWVEGFALNTFVRDHLNQPDTLNTLCKLWLRLGQQLDSASIAHGDFQHGNVLLVPAGASGQLTWRLIDYDGMWVPALAHCPSGEMGHPNYQHPERLREGSYHARMDRFAQLVIYASMQCLVVGGPSLWNRHDNGDNLLFRQEDFETPAASRLFRELWGLPDPGTRALIGHLLLSCLTALDRVPRLADLLEPGKTPVLKAAQEKQIDALLRSNPKRGPSGLRWGTKSSGHGAFADPWWKTIAHNEFPVGGIDSTELCEDPGDEDPGNDWKQPRWQSLKEWMKAIMFLSAVGGAMQGFVGLGGFLLGGNPGWGLLLGLALGFSYGCFSSLVIGQDVKVGGLKGQERQLVFLAVFGLNLEISFFCGLIGGLNSNGWGVLFAGFFGAIAFPIGIMGIFLASDAVPEQKRSHKRRNSL